MKKVLITVLVLFISCGNVFPSDGLKCDIMIDTGITTGTTQEIVYKGDKRISRLDWTDTIIPTAGFTGNISIHSVLFRLGMALAIPVKGGIMEDYDYLLEDSTEPSHYSWHDAYYG